MLRTNATLQLLGFVTVRGSCLTRSMMRCDIGDAGALAFAEMIRENTTLQRLEYAVVCHCWS